LYDYGLATYDTGDAFDQRLSKGFVPLWGLHSQIAAKRAARSRAEDGPGMMPESGPWRRKRENSV
jgi:hypothetical protein